MIDDFSNFAGVTSDSRCVKDGFIFVAISGARHDGHDFIDQAIAAGASVIVSEKQDLQIFHKNVRVVQVENARRCLAQIAAQIYPDRPEHCVAVTGTNGKSSVVHFTREIWRASGKKAASLGTLDGGLTTADPAVLHQKLSDIAQAGHEYCALEASSHGLDQFRLSGLRFQAAAFTNLSRDHLDYHSDMDDYLRAKLRLFSSHVADDGYGVLCRDDPVFQHVADACHYNYVTYGVHEASDLRVLEWHPRADGTDVSLQIFDQRFDVFVPLVGVFQITNLLCALALCFLTARPDPRVVEEYVSYIENISSVPGRLEIITGHPCRAGIYVDYAHTPDALETVLMAVRPHIRGRLYCVFGAGGDRDAGKRPLMGKIAANRSDVVIITDDNPRNEKSVDIRSQILAPIQEGLHNETVFEISDRAAAIDFAIRSLQEGDGLVIAGKGHETYQILGDEIIDFDDRKHAAEAIKRLK